MSSKHEGIKRIAVFVASPSDVVEARDALREIIDELNQVWEPRSGVYLAMRDWREHVTPYIGSRPEQTILDQVPVHSWDLFIGILWHRFGTPPGGEGDPVSKRPFSSGTEEEFTLAYNCYKQLGKPRILFYRCTKDLPFDKLDPEQYQLVQDFFRRFERLGQEEPIYDGYYQAYQEVREFRRHVRTHLLSVLLEYDAQGPLTLTSATQGGSKLSLWLENVGLAGNPFVHWDAGTDSNLPSYFYPAMPYFDEVLGNSPDPPQSAVIFGDHGVGKSAMRQMLFFYSRQRPGNRRVLAIQYTDFSVLAEKIAAGQTITPRDHVKQILQTGIQTLAFNLEDDSVEVLPEASQAHRTEFYKYFHHFAQNLSEPQRQALVNALQLNVNGLPGSNLPDSYPELFYGFCRAIRAVFGYDIVYVLVDQLDEIDILETDEEKLLSLLVPLMADRKLLEPPDYLATFRFFLPLHLQAPLQTTKNVRLGDRLKPFVLNWTDEDLQVIIEQRLRAFSTRRAPYTRLAQLSEIDNLDQILIEEAEGNPRSLVILSDSLISEHCRLEITDDNLQLTALDLDSALKRFRDTRHVAAVTEKSLYSPTEFLPTPIAVLISHYQDTSDESKRLWQGYHLTQVILQFISCSLLALYKQFGTQDAELDEKLSNLLFTASSPPSLGDWRQVMDRLLKIRERIDTPLIEPFVNFRYGNKEVGKCITKLIEARNDAAHGRMEVSEAEQLYEVDEYLAVVINSLESVSHLELMSVDDYDVIEETKLIHKTKLHKGNVMVPERRDVVFERPYPRSRMILYDSKSQTSVTLWPFLIFAVPTGESGTIGHQIFVYDQVLNPRGDKFLIQYTSPAIRQTLSISIPIPDFERMNLVRY